MITFFSLAISLKSFLIFFCTLAGFYLLMFWRGQPEDRAIFWTLCKNKNPFKNVIAVTVFLSVIAAFMVDTSNFEKQTAKEQCESVEGQSKQYLYPSEVCVNTKKWEEGMEIVKESVVKKLR